MILRCVVDQVKFDDGQASRHARSLSHSTWVSKDGLGPVWAFGEFPPGLPANSRFDEKRLDSTMLEVDNIVLCAGQEPLRELLRAAGVKTHLIGGANEASELDAKRAIDQGTRVAAAI